MFQKFKKSNTHSDFGFFLVFKGFFVQMTLQTTKTKWGYYHILSESKHFDTKILIVEPGQMLSLHKHAEHRKI